MKLILFANTGKFDSKSKESSRLDTDSFREVGTCKISLIKNQEISILTIKKRQSEVNTSSTSHREFQRRKGKTENRD
jgi:hypothetical protein